MGLFDVFGAGGGSLTLQLQAMQVAPGQMVGGVVTFIGGKRAQNITSIKVRMYVTQTQPTVPGKPSAGSTTTNIVPEQQLSGPFQVQPGQQAPFQFQFQLPPQMIAEVRGQVDYKISAAADIPGEPDAHATADIQLIGGSMQQPMMGMQQPMMGGMQQPMMGMQQPMMGMQQPMMQQPMGPPQMGQAVMGQHPSGGVYPGKVVAMQNGMIGVDWDDPNLGQSTWLQPQQIQQAPMMQQPMMGQPMMGQPMMGQMGQPMMGQQQPMMGKDMAHQKDMAMHKGENHMGKPGMDMGHKPGMDMGHKPGMDMGKGGGAAFGMGQIVMAQHPQHGGWHQATVVGLQNGMVAVDWADPKLGASAWVQPHQVQHGK